MDTNYFVCTLGQAAQLNKTDAAFTNIPDFLARQAERVGDRPAVAFPVLADDGTGRSKREARVFSFADVWRESSNVAATLKSGIGSLEVGEKVALLCPSSHEFLFAWLALMRLGCAVMLVAPQCHPLAIAHLCRTCGVQNMVFDRMYRDLAERSAEEMQELSIHEMDRYIGEDERRAVETTAVNQDEAQLPNIGSESVAYLHHTSGTSSGLPKPIPQSHKAGLGVLPRLPDDSQRATFTTTPLYHGGIADLFRAWASDALIWLFPGKECPITANYIISSLDTTRSYSENGKLPQVKYFSSVPYVLQMMAADKKGLDYLTSMDIVGVGGAALPSQIGDELVRKGVYLISRFGSAECGFLMSSHRDYEKDKEWQYLRSSSGSQTLKFEKQEDGTSELVVAPGWPHMAKVNRENGSFATADLFAPHPEIPNAWKYHSRADSQLTLITGKKFDPAPLEAALSANPHLDDALIFGNSRPFPGALLFRSAESANLSDKELLDIVQPIVEDLNSESQAHARIPRNMLVPMPHSESALEKSSKGTVMRGKAEERYAQKIQDTYAKLDTLNGDRVDDEDLLEHITTLVQDVVTQPGSLAPDTDLFSYGVDSVGCMQIRYGLRQLLPKDSGELSLSVVEDCGTVKKLGDYILKKRHGVALEDGEDEHALMLSLAKEHSSFKRQSQSPGTQNGVKTPAEGQEVILLTGATGALGAHILARYRTSPSVSKIYCLVRGADQHAASERVNSALKKRGLPGLGDAHVSNSKLVILQSRLGDTRLGLEAAVYEKLARETTIVMHVAWAVNFRMRLRSFVADNIAGVQNLLNLALHAERPVPPTFVYCSSVASVINAPDAGTIPECISDDPASSSPLGYSRSKWVAEQICSNAHAQTPLRSRIAIIRVGQLAGDTVRGVWNTQEAWPMMLSTARLIHCLPALRNEPLNWLPVDVAAEAFVQAAASIGADGESGMRVLHVLNEHQTPDWMTLLEWLKRREEFEVVSPREWVQRLERSRDEVGDHPALKLLGLWKQAYGEDETEDAEKKTAGPVFALQKSKAAAPVLGTVKPVDEEYFGKIWTWLQSSNDE